MSQLDLDLQRLRQANQKLTAACEQLRKANAEGVGDPNLINAAMQAELDALRAARAAEMSQADALLSALTPLLAPQKEGEAV
jgi:hypothetical protein